MRLASLTGDRAAVLLGDQALCIAEARNVLAELDGVPSTLFGIIQNQDEALARLRGAIAAVSADRALTAALEREGALHTFSVTDLMPPLSCPQTIVGFGMNYTDHLSEMQIDRPSDPPCLNKAISSIIGPGASIVLPSNHPDMVDWEAELAVVIGKACYRVTPAEALNHVFGYTAANDVSARDWVESSFAAKGLMETITQWGLNLLGKQFPTFCPLGPAIVTTDEIGDARNLNITCRVNGQVMQSGNTANMVFSSAELISYISNFQRLEPGDVVLTGTMSGVGYGMSPRVFLKSGDVVEVEIENIGILANPVG